MVSLRLYFGDESVLFLCIDTVSRETRSNNKIHPPCRAVLHSYARDGATVELRGVSLFDNTVARGSVVFVVDSVLKTYQVRRKRS